jgi:hypothetical protein
MDNQTNKGRLPKERPQEPITENPAPQEEKVEEAPTKESQKESPAIAQPLSSEPTQAPNSLQADSMKCEQEREEDTSEKLNRMERICELLYWTKMTTVSTPQSAEQAHELDKIYKYKTA